MATAEHDTPIAQEKRQEEGCNGLEKQIAGGIEDKTLSETDKKEVETRGQSQQEDRRPAGDIESGRAILFGRTEGGEGHLERDSKHETQKDQSIDRIEKAVASQIVETESVAEEKTEREEEGVGQSDEKSDSQTAGEADRDPKGRRAKGEQEQDGKRESDHKKKNQKKRKHQRADGGARRGESV